MSEVKEKTYLITHDNGVEQKITVPANWKVTYGPAVAGNQRGPSKWTMPMALRFYEDEKHQRAIFTDVKSFRDLDIKTQIKKVSTQEKQGFMEVDGQRKATMFEARVEEWIDPDKTKEPPKLPDPSGVKDFDVEFKNAERVPQLGEEEIIS